MEAWNLNKSPVTGRSRIRYLFALFLFLVSPACADDLRVVVISDLNGSYGSVNYSQTVRRAVKEIISLKPDLVISTGDMVAGQRQPHLTESVVRDMWKGFHKAVTDPLSAAGIPLAVTPGNHDASAYGGFEHEREIFAEEWRARRPDVDFVDGDDYPFFYAFDIGGARFISLDATTIGALDTEQMKRLDAVLADAGNVRIAFSHLPLLPFAIGRENDIIDSSALRELFERRHLTMHLSGHHHAYYPGTRDGIAFISQACLGSGPRRLIGETARSPHAFTIVDIGEDGVLTVEALTAPDFTHSISVDTLPEHLNEGENQMTRLDLSGLLDVKVATTH